MHYLPDTEDEDSAAEKFWPEGYKQVIREEVPAQVSAQLLDDRAILQVYNAQFAAKHADITGFVDRIAAMVAVGAENGADDAFNDIMDAFLYEWPLPEARPYARYLEPDVLPQVIADTLRQVVIDEYKVDDIYSNAYAVGYADDFTNLEDYMDRVGDIVVVGTKNGANDALEKLYRAFLLQAPLAPARRRPRRLKTW
jgi:hypothetical protein